MYVTQKINKITIITSTLNCDFALKKTAKSIRSQTFKNIQWIIVDGLSNDATLEVIKENLDIVSLWLSETDTGIYDAWNKACNYIEGDWTMFLGAGDVLESTDTLKNCYLQLLTVPNDYNFAYGGLKIENNNGFIQTLNSEDFKPRWIDLNYSTPSHSSTFTRSIILTNSPFDANLKIIGDKDFFLKHSNGKYYNIKIITTIMDRNGISHEIKNIPIIWKENKIISKRGPKVPFLHLLKAYLSNYKNIILLNILGSEKYKSINKL